MTAKTRIAGLLAIVSASFVSPLGIAAERDVITTDRPDVVESSRTVGRGRFQIETSVARERDNNAGVKTTTLTTPTLLRFGIAENLELRLESDGYTRMRIRDANTLGDTKDTGYSDVSPGVKWHVADGEGAKPSIGVLLHADFDSGSRDFRGEGVRPSLRAVFEWELPREFSLGVMPGVIYDKTEGRRHGAGILAAVLGKSWTERFRTFIEVAAERIASSRHGGSTVTYTTGGAYLVTDSIQVDTAFSWGANSNTPDFAWTVGLSIKF
jgi:hypothetical protein